MSLLLGASAHSPLLSRLVAAKETTWGTGVAGTDVIFFTSENLKKDIQYNQSNALTGRVGRNQAVKSVIAASGPVGGEVVYDTIAGAPYGWELFLLAAMGGTATWDAANSLNKYSMSDDVDTSLTIALDKQVAVWEMQGAKCSDFSIKGALGQLTTWQGNYIGKQTLITGDTGIVNTAASIAALAPTGDPVNAVLQDAIVRIGATGSALAAADQAEINEFDLQINHALRGPTYATPANTGHTDAQFSLESRRDGYREVSILFTVPEYSANQIFTWAGADTTLQCDIKYTNGTNEFNIYVPKAKITESPEVPTDGAATPSYQFRLTALVNGGFNTDMTFTDASAIASELGIEVKGARTAAP